MKKFLSLLLLLVCSKALFATIRTVSNFDSAAQYNTIQAAIDASSAGDSVYVNGSPYNYDGFLLTKKLAIFGPGWSPAKDQAYTANVKGCTLRGGTAVSGAELHGLTFIAAALVMNDDNSGTISNVNFIRNRFQGVYFRIYYTYNLSLFEGNWFDNAIVTLPYGNYASYLTFRNNIFYQSDLNSQNIQNLYGDQNNLFDHNLWYGPSSGSADCFYNCSNLHLNNNIFVHRNAYNGSNNSNNSSGASIFVNNITYLTTEDNPWQSPNSGSGNIAGTSPKMVDSTSVNNGVNNPLLNFTLTATSPAKNKGTDALDLGLMYNPGRQNWTRSRASALPFLSKMTLQSNALTVGQKVKFTIDAKSN